jgi:hypothetical protein
VNANMLFLLYWPARTMQAAVRLGIFEQLAGGPQTAAQVAAARGLHPGATERLMGTLAAMGWLYQSGPSYANTEQATLTLVPGSPIYVGGSAHHHAEQLWPLWEHLETAVREGRSVVPEAFGEQSPFDLFHQSPERVLEFLGGMDGGAIGFGEAVASAYDFSHHRHLVDFGGGSGAVSGPIAVRYPHLHVTLLELPPVAAVLGPILQRYGAGGRLRAHAGDFFRPETYPGAFDAALLGRVLHNWSDEKAAEILANIRGALPLGGTVLVLEHLSDTEDPAARTFVALSDLNMLVMTGGGRERSAADFDRLFRAAGLTPIGLQRMAGSLALLIARRFT